MPAPKEVIDLVERFETNFKSYLSQNYNETQVRREFVDPLFKYLGWDIDNSEGHAEAYKDVIHEDAIKVGNSIKAPDYCFRIGGVKKFFLETKKPSVNLKEDIHSSFQLRRYGWSAKLPISILTDFEELAIYDCRIKPTQKDKASIARVSYYTYKDYVSKWDEIFNIFSKQAILKGSFDKFIEQGKGKKGSEAVDEAFLEEIEKWRSDLAQNLAIRNAKLNQRDLNYAVQVTLDRIIFLRICEDRGIENYENLKSQLSGKNIYARLCETFRKADEKYNSGLFHFNKERERLTEPDSLSLSLKVDDELLRDIINSLYYPDSPYEFSVLPPDILGSVYEQFLGKVIRLTDGHRAKIEDKPEVKKAGGVYYTPTYIVSYIIEKTLGEQLDGKNPKEVSEIKILDPACGSGSFLIIAYQKLLDWHLTWYMDNDTKKYSLGRNPAIRETKQGWRLTTNERKRILVNNIFGVDIDSQAVEVTKLSLLLKVLEGETSDTLASQLKLFQERALPDLENNIKCGNSLIGHDYYQREQLGLLEDEERLRVNAFDWKTEFPNVLSKGGFDSVIGNPPYIFTREQISVAERDYYSEKFKASWEKQNTYMLFMESILGLINAGGKGAFIVPNSWLTIESAHLLRNVYIPKLQLILDLNYQVFKKVSMEPSIFVISGKKAEGEVLTARIGSKNEFETANLVATKRERWSDEKHRIVFSGAGNSSSLMDKVLKNAGTIGGIFEVYTGLQAYEKGKGTPRQSAADVKNHIYDRPKKEDSNSYRYLEGKDIGRFKTDWSGMWMQYGPWLSQPRELRIFTMPRVLLREITSPVPYCLNAQFVSGAYLNNKSILNVLHHKNDTEELMCLVGILNSKLMSVFYKQRAVKSARKIFPKVVIKNLREFPYPKKIETKNKQHLVELVGRAMNLQEKLLGAKSSNESTFISREINSNNSEIDSAVCGLFDISDDELSTFKAE